MATREAGSGADSRRQVGSHRVNRKQQPISAAARCLALVQEATADLFREAFAGKEAVWLDGPATEKQLVTLGRYQKRLPEQARAAGWTKREASEAITFYLLH